MLDRIDMISYLETAMFIWPPLGRLLIDEYSWRGASLIIGGIALHGLVFGALLRPPPVKRVTKVNVCNTCDLLASC